MHFRKILCALPEGSIKGQRGCQEPKEDLNREDRAGPGCEGGRGGRTDRSGEQGKEIDRDRLQFLAGDRGHPELGTGRMRKELVPRKTVRPVWNNLSRVCSHQGGGNSGDHKIYRSGL